ncbi:MAG: trypsin-like peptidase domain-containing protein [Candidatus Omnitrophica bacterium]|nr:trypsin-like peptidase domain-containing protein [Candidatus Omnitrophota bacterium]
MTKKEESFCDRPLGPWMAGIVVLAIMLVFWVVMKRDEIMQAVEFEPALVREPVEKAEPKVVATKPQAGEPSFPSPVTQAAMSNWKPAAITKATPNGGMQLIANQTGSVYQNSLKDAVNSIIPSVCDIHARRVVKSPRGQKPVNGANMDFVPPFDGVIDKFVQNKGYENIGAGIIVDSRGYVLTNYHVTMEATDIVVTVFGDPAKDMIADIVAEDKQADLALLKIRGDATFVEAVIGDSSVCQVGDCVIGVGSPFGIEQTVTSGIISGMRKSIVIEKVRYANLFQTDTPINRGSSGGPLVNMSGEVIGINTAIYAPTGVFNGTGFAIPINDCKDFMAANLKRNFTVPVDKRGMIAAALPAVGPAPGVAIPIKFGMEVMPVNPTIALQFGLGETRGVLVNRVLDETPARLAGIQRGDIILSIAGIAIKTKDDVPKVVAHFKSGDNVNVRFFRGGKINEVLVKLQ